MDERRPRRIGGCADASLIYVSIGKLKGVPELVNDICIA
ncbi:hypothetical protein BGLA2_2330008 [Burkholderia gladioli]|nr:hypothetical protein BGLA2_2330008 [Burkholderia gladioli]